MELVKLLIGLLLVILAISVLVINRKKDDDTVDYSNLDIDQQGIDYRVYHLDFKEKLKYALIGYLGLFAISFLFYNVFIVSAIFGLFGLITPIYMRKVLLKRRQDKLVLEFKDALYSIYTSLSAGESPENALLKVPADLKELYVDGNTFIIPEFEVIKRRLELNLSIKEALEQFSERTGVDDIENFTDVFITSIDTGGRQSDIIKNSINTIVEKIEIKREIDIMVASKKFEANIMIFMPIVMIAFLSFFAPDYFRPIYETLQGRFIMTATIIGMLTAYFVSKKILNIEV